MGIALKSAGATPDFDVDGTWDIRRLWSVARLRSEKSGGTWDLLSVFLGRGVIPYGEGGGQVHKPSLDLSAYQLVYPGDLVLNNQQAWRGSVGVSSYRGMVSPAYMVLSLGNVIEPRFANYLFQSRVMVAQFVTSSKGVGDIQRDIHLPWLKNAKVPVPSPGQQTAIVRFLDYVDSRIRRYIRAKQMLIALLEEQKQTIIHRAMKRGLNSNVRLRPSGVEWLGDVPEHWKKRRLKTVLRPVDRRSTAGTETLLSLRRDHGVVVYAEHFSRPPQAGSLVGFKLVDVGQLVVNRLQANNGLIFRAGLSGLVSPDYSVFEGDSLVDMRYLSALLRTSMYRAHFRQESTGLGTGSAGFLRLYDDRLLETPVSLPPLDEQVSTLVAIEADTLKVSRVVDKHLAELALIREYRARLIADTVTGKLDVRDAAARLPQETDDLELVEYADAPVDGDEEAESEELDADAEDSVDA